MMNGKGSEGKYNFVCKIKKNNQKDVFIQIGNDKWPNKFQHGIRDTTTDLNGTTSMYRNKNN